MVDASVIEKVFERISRYRDDVIKIQKDITAIPALSPLSDGKGEWEKALKVKEFMDKIGYDEYYELNAPDEAIPEKKTRPNQVYRIKGKSNRKTVWIMSHYDIVPPGDRKLWDGEPYEIRVVGDEIFGRGVEDNQQGIVSSMLAIKALKEEGLTPEYDIALLFISDEETGNILGIQHILKVKPDIFKKDDIIIVPDSGSEDGSAIEIAEKSILWTKFITKGKQTHASRPDSGINSFRAASHLVVKLQKLHEFFPETEPIFDPPMSTFEPTKKEANVPNVNTIPGEDVFYMDSRIMPCYSIENVKEKIKSICQEIEKEFKVSITSEFPQQSQAAPATPANAEAVTSLAKAVKDVYKVDAKPVGIGGGTVAAYIRKAGFPVVVWATLNETAHQPNEHCNINNVLGDAKVFAHIFLQS